MRITDNTSSLLESKVEGIKNREDEEALKQVCQEFESVFLNIMFKEMQKTIPESDFIGKGTGTEIFEEMYTEELSKQMADVDNGIGIAKMLYDQFKMGNVNI